jgi:hypothetical protein
MQSRRRCGRGCLERQQRLEDERAREEVELNREEQRHLRVLTRYAPWVKWCARRTVPPPQAGRQAGARPGQE